MTITTRFHIDPIPAATLDRVRASGTDVSGNPVERHMAEGGEPLRCCLRDSEPAEQLILFGYEPTLPGISPYREIGAVWAHAEPCEGPAADDRYPAGWYGRRQVLRSYDERGRIIDGRLHDGTAPERVIDELFTEPDAVVIHSRNVEWGCFMFAVTRDLRGHAEKRTR